MRSPLMMTPPSWMALFGKKIALDGLFDGDERADFHVRQALAGLDDDFNAFALLARAGKQRQVAEFREHPAQLRLENHQRADRDEHGRTAENPAQHLQVQNRGHRRERQQHDDEADDYRPAACAAHEAERKINQHREDQNLQRGPP